MLLTLRAQLSCLVSAKLPPFLGGKTETLGRRREQKQADCKARPEQGFPGGTSSKEPACPRRRLKRCGFHPWVGKIPGGGHGNPLQHSCLENPMGRGPRWVIVHGVAKSQTQLRDLAHAHRMDISLPSPLLASSRADAVTQKRTG